MWIFFPAQLHLFDDDAYVVYAAHEPCTFAVGRPWVPNVMRRVWIADTGGLTVQRALTRGHEISSAARAAQSDDDATNERTTTGRNATLCLCRGWVYSISNNHPISGWRICNSVTFSNKIDVLSFNMPYMWWMILIIDSSVVFYILLFFFFFSIFARPSSSVVLMTIAECHRRRQFVCHS